MNYVTGTKEVCGVELDLRSEVDIVWEDDSFSHEFGTEHCGHAEVETVYDVEIDGDLHWYVEREAEAREWWFLKNWRIKRLENKIRKAVEALDPDSFWTDKELDAAVEGWEPPEPEPPEPDEDYEKYYENKYDRDYRD
jgi:hypothetical protein